MPSFSTIKNRILVVAFLSGVMIPSTGCRREVVTPLRVEVRTNQGDPVHEAQVKVAGRIIGTTDAKGMLEAKPAIIEGSQVSVEITKSSDSYYFAPHMETLDLSKSTSRPVSVKAVMYFVPKPKPADVAIAANSTASSVPLSPLSSSPPAASPAASDQTASDQAAALPIKSDPVESPAPAAVSSVEVAALPADEAQVKKEEKIEEIKPEPVKKVLVTFHVYAGETGVAGARVAAIATTGDDIEKTLCTTNVRGRCAVRMESGSLWAVRIIKPGYITESQDLQIDLANKLVRTQIQKGNKMEVLALARGVISTFPLQGVVVSVDGKPAGTTDKSGRFVFTFKGTASNKRSGFPMLKVEMASPRGFLPESAESEFATTGDILLERHFVGDLSKVPVVTVEESRQSSSSLDGKLASALLKMSDASLDRKVFSRKILIKAGKGQKNPDLRIRRSLARSEGQTQVELVAIDAKGIVMAAAKETLEGDFSKAEVAADFQKKMDALAERLMRSLPFQGVIMASGKDQIRALLPGQLAAIVKPGDRFDVFGVQTDARARRQSVVNVATAKVPDSTLTSAGHGASSDSGAELTLMIDSATAKKQVSRGDVVVMRGLVLDVVAASEKPTSKPELVEAEPAKSKTPSKAADSAVATKDGSFSVLVRNKASDDPRPIAQANVYFNDVWVGTSNSNGVVYLPRKLQGTAGKLSVVKAGWNPGVFETNLTSGRQVEVAIEPEASRLRLDSVPAGATVFLDGKLAGKTPLDTKLDGSGAFLKLEITGPDGFKKYSSILEIDAGTLELTGPRAIQLEDDVVTRAKKISDVGKINEAIVYLAKVPPNHSDYLVSRHMAGELALGKLNDPVMAEKFFSTVTSAVEVRDFIDKRFIGSHINEGIAIHMIAEKDSRSNPKVAADGFARAAAILDRASKFTRFLPKKDFKQSVKNLEYFRALSFHRRWLLINDQNALEQANRAWTDYLDSLNAADDSEKQVTVLAANARVYLKQTQAGLSKR